MRTNGTLIGHLSDRTPKAAAKKRRELNSLRFSYSSLPTVALLEHFSALTSNTKCQDMGLGYGEVLTSPQLSEEDLVDDLGWRGVVDVSRRPVETAY